ncbi:hypothetical protein IBTHAUMO2_1050003 [Nitrosopumilaceae archaeon]|nr:hypothetical protein IBTHAUMO2_1050003 [Nitrosopumilaceae archaeon]
MAARRGEKVTVDTNEPVLQDGHYSYDGHVGGVTGCKVPDAARWGMYLAKGSKAPCLVTCGHVVRWRLDPPQPGSAT